MSDFGYGELYVLQHDLCRLFDAPTSIPPEAKSGGIAEFIMEAAVGLVVESSEILDALNKEHRIWKEKRDIRIEVEREAVDVLFYLIELFNILDLTDEDVFLLYLRKYVINLMRFLGSYPTPVLSENFNECRSDTVFILSTSTNKIHNAFGLLKRVMEILVSLDPDFSRFDTKQREIIYDINSYIGGWLFEKVGERKF